MPVHCVLVVDDDPDQRDGLAEILEISGYCVATAANGWEALEVAVKISPDLILLDLDLPVMDGPEVMDALRRDVGLREIPVIVISGRSELPRNVHAISKPFAAERLLERIQRVLEGTVSPWCRSRSPSAAESAACPGSVRMGSCACRRVTNGVSGA